MFKIKRTSNHKYVVFDTNDFSNHHTHTNTMKIAKIIKDNVEKHRRPLSKDIRMLESHLRLANDPRYREMIIQMIEDVERMHRKKSYYLKQLHSSMKSLANGHLYLSDDDKKEFMKLYEYINELIERLYYQPTSYTIQIPYTEVIYEYKDLSITISIDESMIANVQCMQDNILIKEFSCESNQELRKRLYKILLESEMIEQMAKIFNVEKSGFTNAIIESYHKDRGGKYSKFLDKNPLFVTWYHISTVSSRVDVGTGGIESEIGERSPIRYCKITDLPVYNIPELKPDVTWDETGYDIELDLNGLVLLPRTVKPLPGDYFILDLPGSKQFLFRVIQPRYNTIQSNDYYEFDADIKYVGNNVEMETKLNTQIVATYKTIFELIGTDDRCFIQDTDIDQMNGIGTTFQTLVDMYRDAFYNPTVNAFLFSTGYTSEGFPSVLYDPYLDKFINDSKIFYVDNEAKTLYLVPLDVLQEKFHYLYSRTIYRAIIDQDTSLLSPNIYSIISPVTKRFSPLMMYQIYGDSVKLILGAPNSSPRPLNQDEIWFSIKNLPCCGPTWTPNNSYSYFSYDFMQQLLGCQINTTNIMELIIFNYIHNIKGSISASELIKSVDVNSIQTFYYLPIVCFILSKLYEDFFKSDMNFEGTV